MFAGRSFRIDLCATTAIYLASYLLYRALGVTFDSSTFPHYMQFIDVDLLQHRLLESVWYYHANPPLLNLGVGVALKLFAQHPFDCLARCFHILGLATLLAVFVLTRWISTSRMAAYVAAVLFAFSPSFILYQNWLMYSFPAAALLACSAVALFVFARERTFLWGSVFFSCLALLLLTRSLFHLVWMIAVAVLVFTLLKGSRKVVAITAALPLLVVIAWYSKNYMLFGTFSGSTWFGLGLSNISTLAITKEELQPLVERGQLSKYALVSRYRQIDQLFAIEVGPPTGIPVLDQVRKSSGEYNFNYRGLVEINRIYAADGIRVIRTFPASYVIGLIIANRLYFSPTSMNLYFSPANRKAVAPMERLFDPILYGISSRSGWIQQPHFGFSGDAFLEVNTSIPLLIGWWVVLGYGYFRARRAILSREDGLLPAGIVVGFIVFTACYVYAIGTGFELAENYRYRWLIEPLFLVLEVSMVSGLIGNLSQRWKLRRHALANQSTN